MAIKEGDFIEIDYTGRVNDSDKAIFDTTDGELAKTEGIHDQKTKYGPVIIVVGESQVIPGLDKAFVGKEPGKYRFEIEDVDAFGKKDAKLMQLVPAKVFAKENIRPFVGLQVNIDDRLGVIRSVSGGRVMVDFNHPLSSKDVVYDVEIKRIVTDTKEKVQAFFDAMGLPYEKITADEKQATVTTKQMLPEQFTKPLSDDIKRLTGVQAVSFEAGNKKEEKPVAQVTKTEKSEAKKETKTEEVTQEEPVEKTEKQQTLG